MQNFVIVGTQRTGSTALFRSLNFHPEVACGSEWTLRVPALRKLRVMQAALAGDFAVLPTEERRRIERVFSERTRMLGFKLLFRSSAMWLGHPGFAPALWLDRLSAFLRWFSARPDFRIIHIVRRDPVEWLKSKYISDTVKAFAGKIYPDDIRVRIPVAGAMRRIVAKDWIDRRLEGLARTNPYVKVAYEDFLRSDADVVAQLMEFLARDPALLTQFDYRQHRKQSVKSARDYIVNFDEVVAALVARGLIPEAR